DPIYFAIARIVVDVIAGNVAADTRTSEKSYIVADSSRPCAEIWIEQTAIFPDLALARKRARRKVCQQRLCKRTQHSENSIHISLGNIARQLRRELVE